jgi:hypothetical protein
VQHAHPVRAIARETAAAAMLDAVEGGIEEADQPMTATDNALSSTTESSIARSVTSAYSGVTIATPSASNQSVWIRRSRQQRIAGWVRAFCPAASAAFMTST